MPNAILGTPRSASSASSAVAAGATCRAYCWRESEPIQESNTWITAAPASTCARSAAAEIRARRHISSRKSAGSDSISAFVRACTFDGPPSTR